MAKQQLHKRFSTEQVQSILGKVREKKLKAKEACKYLGIGRTQLYKLSLTYQRDPDGFAVSYKRHKPSRLLAPRVKAHIISELSFEKHNIIDNPDVPTSRYNYSYIRNIIVKQYREEVSLPTLIAIAKTHGFYKPKRKNNASHTRLVLTNFVGELIQHDSSPHLYSPDAHKKWSLITSLDDYSRKILSARLVLSETVWQHITSVEDVCLRFGIPFSYYVDQHSIFRYVKDRDQFSIWTTYTKFTGDVDTQWAAMLRELSIKPIYALSPQAKGKIERPYQWLQDHLVRTCVRYGISSIQKAQEILDEEVYAYNGERIHSVTGEIPDIRFNRALKEGKTLFRPFAIPSPFQSTKDVFALRQQRRTDGYRSISFFGRQLKVPRADPYMPIDVRYAPGGEEQTIDFRFWTQGRFLGTQTIPSTEVPHVHF